MDGRPGVGYQVPLETSQWNTTEEAPAGGRESRRERLHDEWEVRVRSDYAYVKRDIRNIGILSTLLLTLLLLLWVFIEVLGAVI